MKNFNRVFLSVVIAAVLLLLSALPSLAADFPSRPLTIVVPAATGGTNDNAARLMAPYLSKELGQPVTIVNRPGGGNLMGHIYFQRQPADGYTLLRSSSFAFFTINILIQNADFKIEDFQYINMTDQGNVMIGTSNDSRHQSIDDLVAALRKNPENVSIGVQPTQVDNINLMAFLKALNVPAGAVRIVTYDSGGPLRNAMTGGQFDAAVVGDQGMGPRKGTFRMLMHFMEERCDFWNVPTVLEVMKKQGVTDYPDILPGSMQGYFVHSKLKQDHPGRYERIVKAFENISKNPEAIEAHRRMNLGIEWMGPERSQQLMMRAHKTLSKPELLQMIRPK